MTAPGSSGTRARPTLPGALGNAPERAPLSTYGWSAITTLANQPILVIEIESNDIGDGSFGTQPDINRELPTGTIGTSASDIARPNANRSKLYVVNTGSVAYTVFPGKAAAIGAGIVLQPNGGFLSITGNKIEVVAPGGARLDPADRNAFTYAKSWNENPGAAGFTTGLTLITYTVPAGRRAEMTAGHAMMWNDSNQALTVSHHGRILYIPNLAAGVYVLRAMLLIGQASGVDRDVLSRNITLFAGETLNGEVASGGATAGSNKSVELMFAVLEYDA